MSLWPIYTAALRLKCDPFQPRGPVGVHIPLLRRGAESRPRCCKDSAPAALPATWRKQVSPSDRMVSVATSRAVRCSASPKIGHADGVRLGAGDIRCTARAIRWTSGVIRWRSFVIRCSAGVILQGACPAIGINVPILDGLPRGATDEGWGWSRCDQPRRPTLVGTGSTRSLINPRSGLRSRWRQMAMPHITAFARKPMSSFVRPEV